MEKHTWLVSRCGSLWDNAVTERVIGTTARIDNGSTKEL